NLLTRAAGVQLKERRALVLLAREAPLTLAHLRNMTSVTEMGGIILPPVPAFYLHPESLAEVVDQIAARSIDLLRLGQPQAATWTG
ncbi:MAG: phenolic acid decarboxylase, partial [Paracoccaceae bacterium]|nr:phenolic acid decarboxylase [Paracoccaceae bacterium]